MPAQRRANMTDDEIDEAINNIRNDPMLVGYNGKVNDVLKRHLVGRIRFKGRMVLDEDGNPTSEHVRMPSEQGQPRGPALDDNRTRIFNTVRETNPARFIPHLKHCGHCYKQGIDACFYDGNTRTTTCIPCAYIKHSCSIKEPRGIAAAHDAVATLAGAAMGAAPALAAWTEETVRRFRENL